MSNEKIKTYRSRQRGAPEQAQPYVPQYQVWGKEPSEYKSAVLSGSTKVAQTSEDNPRVRKVGIRQPYAAPVASPVGRGRGPIPNVGNNVEHTWSSVDGDIIDDLPTDHVIDSEHAMVDNNDFVSDMALGLQEELPMLDEVQNPTPKQFIQRTAPSPQVAPTVPEEDLFPVVRDLDEGSYLLIVSGVPICSGPKEEIQEQASALIFGEHEICDGNPIPDDDIVIIKRIPIKVGLFLE
jgi:hypothetical protein